MNKTEKGFLFMGYFLIFLMFPFLSLYGKANIYGHVTDAASSATVEGIKITLVNIPCQEAMTDAEGFYQFVNIPSGKYTVYMEIPAGYMEVSANPVVVSLENLDAKANFSLSLPGRIEGVIKDSYTNLPIPHANVDIKRGSRVVASTVTDEQGYYYVSGLAPKPHILKVKAPSYQSNGQIIIPIAGQTTLFNLALEFPPGKITGQIVHFFTGQSIADATIEILKDDFIIDSVQSNEEGFYTLSLAPNTYEVRITLADFKSSTQLVNIVSYATTLINFALEPCGTLAGQVVHFFTNQPIEGASVGIWQNGQLFLTTSTDANGYFKLKGHGHYQLIIQAPGFHPLEQGVQINSLQTNEISLKLTCFEPHPPNYFQGKVIKKMINHHIFDYIHQFTWEASSDPSVVSYRLYCEEICLATIAADDTFYLEIHGRKKKPRLYQLKAVNAFGQESRALTIRLSSKK